jgi:importin-9
LTEVIQKDCAQVLTWKDANGVSGLDHVLSVIAKLLDDREEAGSLFIGDLIIHLLRKSGDAVLPVLPGLLQAMVTRMTTAKSDLFLEVGLTVLYPISWIHIFSRV